MRWLREHYQNKRRAAAAAREQADSTQLDEQLNERIDALYDLLTDMYGVDRLVLKAGKVDALTLMRSDNYAERALALQRLVFDDPERFDAVPTEDVPQLLEEIHEAIADRMARHAVEEDIERRINMKMQERHDEYVRDIRMQVLKENTGPDNAQTLRKYAELEKKDAVHLSRSANETFRPKSVADVVGQDDAIQALFTKVATPYPQHIILYGPPGVGKTTVARLALEHARTLAFTPFDADAPFVEVDGSTLRWDPREATNPLLGSVHDPIYQGARRDLAESAIPEPKPGLVTDAHGGVLFIDEIGELDPALQNKLLKVLEEKRVHFDSAYYDPHDENVPKYIKKLFADGAPADFILIGATTRDPSEINPALRSRCAEVFFDPLTADHIATIVSNMAGKIGAALDNDVPELIGQYTREGRRAVAMLADAYGMALAQWAETNGTIGDNDNLPPVQIKGDHVKQIAQVSRLTPHLTVTASDDWQVGRIFGMGVMGFTGSLLEIEAIAFPASAPGKGTVRFNETAGSMAKDSVFNATSVVRRFTGENMADWDVHVNVIGGGRIDGPSAGLAVVMAIMSAIWERPMRQDVAVTGELSIQGRVRPVGGIHEKVHAAAQAGMRRILVPKDNYDEAPVVPGTKLIPISGVADALPHLFGEQTPFPEAMAATAVVGRSRGVSV